jgi:hypothetical protein
MRPATWAKLSNVPHRISQTTAPFAQTFQIIFFSATIYVVFFPIGLCKNKGFASDPSCKIRTNFHSKIFERGAIMWRQGFGEWFSPLQSPVSTAGLPAALGGGHVWRIAGGVQHAYIIINSLQTDM